MVRVSGVAAATASSWTQKTANLVTFVLSTIPRRRSHRDAAYHRYESHRSRFRGRKKRRYLSFTFIAFVMLITFATLQWYLLSFMVISKNNTSVSPKPGDNMNTNDPIWNACPAIDNESTKTSSSSNNNNTNKDICFLTCIFGESIETVDRPANVEWFKNYWCHTRFLLATNIPDLPAPGWTRIVTNTSLPEAELGRNSSNDNKNHNNNTTLMTKQQTNIVLSRHAKFLAWEALPGIVPANCAAVVYMDGYLAPIRYQSWWALVWSIFRYPIWSPASPLFLGSFWDTQVPPPQKFQNLVRQVQSHPWGLSQVKQKYFDGLSMTTLLNNLVRDRKDTKEHVENTLAWFRSQEEGGNFREVMPYYLNKYFGE